ncbi:CCA tRNA nucleotidyltransferase [Baaleninema sp.]|uniref:CCA tRNA nucleotidyltransferase n=1 Tax=Baaleninema sp. TaxID=3101197 RepID=UPI003D0264EE
MNSVERRDRIPAVLLPENWPFSLEWLPPEACLVGGAVRDALLDRQSDYLDLDFVVPENAVEIARSLARHYRAGFVVLDAERQIARVVFENADSPTASDEGNHQFSRATVDFALQEGESLEIDLHRRDFTINAIAYNPHTGHLVDPLGGYDDLQQRQLRMVSRQNLEDDPLRLLRGYRQAAQLQFELESHTRETIRELAPLLRRVAAERVYSEFSYLFTLDRGTPWLEKAWEDGLLSVWFPSATAEDVKRLPPIDRSAKRLVDRRPELAQGLQSPIRSTLKTTGVSVAKLASLVDADPEAAEAELLRLKYSRLEVRATVTLLRAWEEANSDRALQEMSVRAQYFWFKALGDVFPAYATFALASGVDFAAIAPYLDRYLTPNDAIAHPQPLISGRDLIEKTHLSKGPQIGYWLTEIAIARAEGKISTAEEALQWAIRHG